MLVSSSLSQSLSSLRTINSLSMLLPSLILLFCHPCFPLFFSLFSLPYSPMSFIFFPDVCIPCFHLLFVPCTVPKLLPFTIMAWFPLFPVVLTPSLCVCLCLLLCMVRSPWAASCSLAHCHQMPMQTTAAATCWSLWMIQCLLRRSLVPPTPLPPCLDQSLTTWMVRETLTSLFECVCVFVCVNGSVCYVSVINVYYMSA